MPASETTTWYRADLAMLDIRPVQVLRETPKMVFILGLYSVGKETRHTKRSQWGHYYPTREMAHAFLLGVARSRVASAERRLDKAHDRLNALQNPVV